MDANSNAILFDRAESIGIAIHGAVGGISALVTLLLLFHIFMVAAVRRGEPGKVTREKAFLLTRLGAYFTCLLIADLLISFGQFIQALWASLGGITEGPLCTTQSTMIQIGGYGTAVFSSVIAIHTFCVIVLRKTSTKSVTICVIILGWSLPIGLDLVVTFLRRGDVPFYGLAQHWCWIRPEHPTLRVLLHVLPILLSALISVVCYSLLFFVVRGNLHIDGGRVTLRHGWQGQMESNEDYRDMLSMLANRMLWYPISYIVLIMPMMVVQLLLITHHTVPFAAWVVSGIALASLGFFNVVIYCITRVILGRSPTPTAWDAGTQDTFIGGSPSSSVKEKLFKDLQDPSKFDRNGATSNTSGQASAVPLNVWQPPPTSHYQYPAVPQPVVHAHPRNSPPQRMVSHQRGDSEATMVEQWAYGHPSRSSSYSLKRSSSMAAPAPPRGSVPEAIIAPQRPTTPSSVLTLNRRSTSPNEYRHDVSRVINYDTRSSVGSLAQTPRRLPSHSPSTSIGSRLEHSTRGTGRGQSVEHGPSSWRGPSGDAPLSAVLGPQNAPAVPPTHKQPAQRSPYSPNGPFVQGHHRTRSRPGFL